MAIFYSGSLLSGAFGSLLAAGILKGLAGVRGMVSFSSFNWLHNSPAIYHSSLLLSEADAL